MANGPEFPAFLKIEVGPDAKSTLLAELGQMAGDGKRQFEQAFGEIGKTISNSLSGFKGGGFKLDLDTSGLRQAAADADFALQKLQELQRAASARMPSTSDPLYAETVKYTQALSAQIIEAREAKEVADAQVRSYSALQAEIDKTAASNSRLADSYRATFIEQAKAENYATAFQKAINERAGTNLNNFGPSKRARDSASVFEAQQFKVSSADTRSGLERMLAGSASIDKAALSGVTLESVLGRVSKKSSEVAGALDEAKRAAEALAATRLAENEAALARAAAEAKSYAAAADSLMASVDPMAAAQQRFNSTMTEAKRLLDANAISTDQYAQVQSFAQQQLSSTRDRVNGVAEAQRQLEQQQKQAAASQQEMASAAANLRAQLDPALAVQQRFDAELARADQLLEAGAISTKEYAQAQALARQNLTNSWEAITRTQAAQQALNEARKRGTTETGNVINGIRAERTAFTQLGQQMQDVVVQAQMGTSALTIFTQQVPQAALALSGLSESSNKTKAAIGNIATFLSGPWGAAIFAATAIMGPFILSLFNSGDAADDAKSKTYDFSKSLDILSLSAKEATNAMQQLEQASRSAISVQGDFVEQQAATTAAAIADIEGRLAKSQKQLAEIKKLNQGAGLSLLPDSDFSGQAKLEAQIATDQEALAKLKLYRTNYEIALSQRRINEAMDAGTRATGEYRRAIGKLEERRIKSEQDPIGAQAAGIFLSEQQYQAEYARLTKLRDETLEAQKKVGQKAKEASLPKVTGQEIADLLGTTITSQKRSAAQNKAVGGSANSYHLTGMAIDIPLTVNGKPLTKEGIRAALEPAGVVIKELLGPGDKGHNDHFHIAFAAKRAAPDKIDQMQQKRTAEALRMLEEQIRAYQQIADEQARSRDSIEGMLTQQERQLEIQRLVSQGRESEADALELQYRVMDQLGIEEADLLQTALEIAGVRQGTYEQMQKNLVLQRQQNREEENARRLQQRNLQAIAGIKDSIARTIYEIPEKGIGAIGGFFDRLQDQFRQDLADALTESLFGDAFKSAEETLRDAKKVEADSSLSAARALNTLARAADKAAVAQSGGIAGVPSSIAAGLRVGVAAGTRAANDNEAAITVIAQRLQDFSDPRRLYAMAFEKLGEVVFGPEKAKMFGQAVGSALEGAAYGQMGGGIVGARSTEGKIGSSIGGMLGQEAGKSIFKALGSFAGPLGGLIGGALGGIIGGLFKKTTSGAVSLGVNQFGAAGISNTIGNSAALQKEATGYGGAVAGSLNRIAEQLGGVVGDFSVAIGKRSSGWIKVSASGNAAATTGKKVTSDIIYNGKDEAEAIRAALLNAIQDGAIKGIREGAQRLLKAGSDIEAQLQKAMDFQSVFDRLKAYKDPVGAALDTLNREFEKLKRTFAEAGASAAEYAELEELYGIERAKAIKEAAQRVTGSLQALLDDLMIGDTGLSLRDRRANAKAAYDPLAARVAAGDVSAYDDYVKAAQALLDIERQISGSTQAYFDLRDEVAGLTKTQIDAQQAKIDAATNSDSPFVNSSVGGDNQAVIEALNRLGISLIDGLGGRLDAVNDNLGALILAGTGGSRVYNLPALSYENYF